MNNWIAFDLEEWDFSRHDSEEEAKKAAEDFIDQYRMNEGWPELLEGQIGYAKVCSLCEMINKKTKEEAEDEGDEDWNDDCEYTCDFELKKVGVEDE